LLAVSNKPDGELKILMTPAIIRPHLENNSTTDDVLSEKAEPT
jgi:hypothetical protein